MRTVDGMTILRLVVDSETDGLAVERWDGSDWVPGGESVSGCFLAPWASDADLEDAGVP